MSTSNGQGGAPSSGLGEEDFVVPEPDLQAGDKVGEYVVEGKLGAGGFGAVFKAIHPVIGKEVAIKLLNRQYSSNPQMVSRFIAEARAVNQIRHRHIIDIFSFGQLADGRQYYVMELLAGEPLDRYLKARGRLGVAETVAILRAVGRALDAAHGKGIAHRDIKPENIYISMDEDGAPFPKLLDFGIAKLMADGNTLQHKTRTGAPVGTPYYMSPEQCRGRDVDARTDIYSFGVVAYQLLTGKLPFEAAEFMDIMFKQIGEEPVPPSKRVPGLSEAVDRAVAAMMAKDPARRPPSLSAAVRGLEDAAVESGLMVAPASRSYDRQDGAATPSPASRMAGFTPAPGNAVTLASTHEGGAVPTTQPPALPARRRRRGWIAGTIVVAGVAVAGLLLLRPHPPAGVLVDPPADAAPAADVDLPTPLPPEPEPAAADAAPAEATVTLLVAGVPPGTEAVTADGRVLGKLPGKLLLARGDEPIKITFRARGYKAQTRELVPRADAALELTLERRRPTSTPADSAGKRPNSKDDFEGFEN